MEQTNLVEVTSKKENGIYRKKVKYLQNYFWIVQDLLDELVRNQEDIKASSISDMPKSKVITTIDNIYINKEKSKQKIELDTKKLFNKNNLNLTK